MYNNTPSKAICGLQYHIQAANRGRWYRPLIGTQGRIQDFKLGGAQLKILRRAEGGAKIFGVFRVKNYDFMPKNNIFSNFRGGAPPPESAPGTDDTGRCTLIVFGTRLISFTSHYCSNSGLFLRIYSLFFCSWIYEL